MSPNGPQDQLKNIQTSSYTIHHLNTLSGLRFVLNSDHSVTDLQAALLYIYSNIFVENVVKNPFYQPKSGMPIQIAMFDQKLEQYLRTLPCFS
ncbi:unnamed protein product [Heterosigma akashiwo]